MPNVPKKTKKGWKEKMQKRFTTTVNKIKISNKQKYKFRWLKDK